VLDIIENEIWDKIEKSSLIIWDSMSDFLFAKNCGLNFISVYKKFDGIKFFYSFADLENYILWIR
jgi:hypothetical protein